MKSGSNQSDRDNRRRGFTLIEVLIAVVVLSTGIVLILQGLHGALAVWDGAVDRLRGVMLARETLEEIRLEASVQSAVPEDNSGRFERPFDRYLWRTEVSSPAEWKSASQAAEAGSLVEVRCTVWRELSERDFSVSTRIYVPAEQTGEKTDDGAGEVP